MPAVDTFKQLEESWISRSLHLNPIANPTRSFHGPIECPTLNFAIDIYTDSATQYHHAWVTQWGGINSTTKDEITKFLTSKNISSITTLDRSQTASQELPVCWYGQEHKPTQNFVTLEDKIKLNIDLNHHRHPGLFLDLHPLRHWLNHNIQNFIDPSPSTNALNLFCFTGSLSLAAKLGGIQHVTSIDLSKKTINWARSNWDTNLFKEEDSTFIAGDVFDWIKRFKKNNKKFDCVISDPPSFSRGKNGTFSTERNLDAYHNDLVTLVKPGGIVASVINTAKVDKKTFDTSLNKSCAHHNLKVKTILEVSLPPNFLGTKTNTQIPPELNYLKGLIIQAFN